MYLLGILASRLDFSMVGDGGKLVPLVESHLPKSANQKPHNALD